MFDASRLRVRLCAWSCAALVCASPSVALAQFNFSNMDGDLLFSTTTVIYGLATVAVTAATVPLTLTTMAAGAVADQGQKAALEQYLRENQEGLREAVTMGAGGVFEDFAVAFELTEPERVALGKVLRGARAELLELAREDVLDVDRAGEFARVLSERMREEPVLAAAMERALEGGS